MRMRVRVWASQSFWGFALACVFNAAVQAADTSVIQNLIDAAQPGDTVNLPAGTYAGDTLLLNKPIVLVGAEDSSGNPATILDGEGQREVIDIEAVSYTHLTLQTTPYV